MYELQQICRFMEQWAPPALAEEWDNPGLLVDAGSLVRRVLVTLDITPAVVEEAHRLGCQLVVSHHPVIFKPVRRLQSADAAFLLARYGISALCAHTNLDAAEGGVNDVLAGLLELEDVQPLEGLGRVVTGIPSLPPSWPNRWASCSILRCCWPTPACPLPGWRW